MTTFASELAIGTVRVGRGHPPLFLPDIDVYFKGDVGLAMSLIGRLREAGVAVVKGALIHDAALCFDGAVEATYLGENGRPIRERYRDVIARHVLPLADAERIYRHARSAGLDFILTVYDRESTDFAVRLGAAALKIASSCVTHAPLIRDAAGRGLPLLLDTGRSTLDEIARAVSWAREAGANRLILQHSPEPPPAPLSRHHLRMIPTLSRVFDCPVGLSDHHAGNEMLVAAVALGACLIEKGVCDDGARADIDLAHAARISQIDEIVRSIQAVWVAMGDPMRVLPLDRPRPPDRMALIAARSLRSGDPVDETSVRFVIAAPPEAIGVEEWDRIRSWTISREIAAGEAITWDCLRPAQPSPSPGRRS